MALLTARLSSFARFFCCYYQGGIRFRLYFLFRQVVKRVFLYGSQHRMTSFIVRQMNANTRDNSHHGNLILICKERQAGQAVYNYNSIIILKISVERKYS